jgi:hypothetical protein
MAFAHTVRPLANTVMRTLAAYTAVNVPRISRLSTQRASIVSRVHPEETVSNSRRRKTALAVIFLPPLALLLIAGAGLARICETALSDTSAPQRLLRHGKIRLADLA